MPTVRHRSDETSHRAGLRVLITDLDNTLWDWFRAWYVSFNAMLERLTELSGVPREILEAEIRVVHQLRGTSEYSNLLNELPSLQARSGDRMPLDAFDEAVHVLHSRRRSATALYPGVRETLIQLKRQGVTIAAYTESIAYWTQWRIKHTRLDGVIDVLYSAPDHDLPDGMTFDDLRRPDLRTADDYQLGGTVHRYIPKQEVKPNPEVLKAILSDLEFSPDEALYVGDSLMKDIAMAQQAHVLDAHAKYGEAQHVKEYELLRRVSHWPDAAVTREKELIDVPDVVPTVVLEETFSEILHQYPTVSMVQSGEDCGRLA
ncbi:HAD family hydrolase [Mycolicibacterium fortuitum]|nr:HAD family hydrolase [Mycolicibacterium fortuitum]